MAHDQKQLREKSAAILTLIAAGHSYDQILARTPNATYVDIFAAASEAVALLGPPAEKHPSFVERARKTHKRAFEKWTPSEDADLTRLFHEGMAVNLIAQALQRHRGAITSRILKLGLDGGATEVSAQAASSAAEGERSSDSANARGGVPGWDHMRRRLDQM